MGGSPDEVEKATEVLLAKVPTLAAYGYKNSIGAPTLYPDNRLSYIENFERMSFGSPMGPYELNDTITRALEVLLILHADHEQNCSTSTVRLVGSSGANIYVSVASGVNALSGPLHGGANQEVLEMLQAIKDSGLSVTQFVDKVKNKESGIKLMGFGHRVYKNYDPRAEIIKKHADEVLKLKEGRRDLLDIAQELEAAALSDEYFIARKLYPNVDFYSGLIYEAMGFPVNMFTVLFAIGRLPGWIAQWREQHDHPRGQDRASAPDLRRPDRARLRADRPALRLNTQTGGAAAGAAHDRRPGDTDILGAGCPFRASRRAGCVRGCC